VDKHLTFYGPFSATAGLDGAFAKGKFKAFPNPTRDLENIKLSKAGVYNIPGQKMGTVTANISGQMQWQLGGKAVSSGDQPGDQGNPENTGGTVTPPSPTLEGRVYGRG